MTEETPKLESVYDMMQKKEPLQEQQEKINEEDIELELTETQITDFLKKELKDSSLLKNTTLKNISGCPNKIIKTIIQLDDIQPGVNLTKGFVATCPKCKKTKTIYSSYVKECAEVFKKEHEKAGTTGCFEIGIRGGKKEIKVDLEPINDTGYFCQAYDPDDLSGNPQYTNVFFSNKLLASTREGRLKFEIDSRAKNIEIIAVFRYLQGNKSAVNPYFLDVQSHKVLEREIKIDKELLYKYKDIEKNDDFFNKHFTPKIVGRVLNKKISSIFTISPHRAIFPNGNVNYTTLRILDLGDPGQSKTVQALDNVKYFEGTNVSVVSVENATQRGILGKAVKNNATNQWVIRPGEILKRNGTAIFLDGYGKFNQIDYAQMRGVEEENILEITKAGGIKTECVLHIYAMGNVLRPVEEYSNKHKATFDLAATTSDSANKFSGADRRRFDHVTVIADKDISHIEINKHKINHSFENEQQDIKYWNNLREFSWSRKPTDFIWEKGVIQEIEKHINTLIEKYRNFSLDYGILSKKGLDIFLKQLPAVALLHNSIEDGKIIINNTHVEWLAKLYIEELNELGLNAENEQSDFYIGHAKKILENCSVDAIEVLELIKRYGSQAEIERQKIMGRNVTWRRLKEVITYSIKYKNEDEESKDKEIIETCYYSFIRGSLKMPSGMPISSYDILDKILIEDFILDPLNRRDGSFTKFGKILLQLAEKYKQDKNSKKIIIDGDNNGNT